MSVIENVNKDGKVELEVGDKVYFHGDMANRSGVAEVVEVKEDSYHEDVLVYVLDFDDRVMEVEDFNFSKEYKGNGRTRFVPYEAYKEYREEKIKQLRDSTS